MSEFWNQIIWRIERHEADIKRFDQGLVSAIDRFLKLCLHLRNAMLKCAQNQLKKPHWGVNFTNILWNFFSLKNFLTFKLYFTEKLLKF